MPDWFKTSDEDIRFWEKSRHTATSTAVAAKFAPALLIDSNIEAAAEAAEKLVREYFEKRGDIYVCLRWPTKRLILLRTDEPFAKLSRTLFCPNDDEHQLEILGDGQMYVVDGDADGHVGKPARWLGGDLRTIQHKNLPDTQRGDAEQILNAIVKVWVEEFGFVLENPTTRLQWILNNARKAEARIAAYNARKSKNKCPQQKATIHIMKGAIARVVDEAENALLAVADVAPIMVRAGMLVQPIVDQLPASYGRMTDVTLLRPLTNANVIYLLNKHAAVFAQYDGRSKKWLATDPPDNVATQLLQKGQWRFPKVAGVITAPTLRPNGSILDRPGYDPATQLWYSPNSQLVLPQLLEEPTREQAEQALKLLTDLLVGFPFESGVDYSVALAAILTAVLRGAFDVVPMNLLRAHDVGSGKSFLIDLISTIARGQVCPVITNVKSMDEMEKRLGALVLEGVPMVSLDNCSDDIGGDLLCQITERRLIRIRILGKSEMPECEWRGVLFASGNNITYLGDMTRRGLIANLDAKVERPELREFSFDPIQRVLNNRGAYIAAAITIARAYIAARSPNVSSPLGSYRGWTRFVRSPLVWLGKEDPVKSMEEMRQEDPGRRALHSLIELWHDYFTLNTPYTASDLVVRANELANPIGQYGEPEPTPQTELRELLLLQAGTPRGEIDTKILGHWLTSVHGRVYNGMCIELVKESRAHGNKYALVAVA